MIISITSFQPQGTFYDKKADYAEKSTMGFDVIPGKREDCELAIVSPQPHSKRVLSNYRTFDYKYHLISMTRDFLQ